MDNSSIVLEPLDDPHNKVVRSVRHLLRSRTYRHKMGQAVLEGPRVIQDALAAGLPLAVVLYSPRFIVAPEHRSWLLDVSGRSRLLYVTDRLLEDISDVEAHQGLLAIARCPLPVLHRLDDLPRRGLTVVVDGIQDPGNLGTIVRGAAASGATGLIFTEGTVDALNPKVVRATAGTLFRIPVFRAAEDWQEGYAGPVYVAAAHEGEDYDRVEWPADTVLCLGNEARGVTTVKGPVRPVRIPMAAGVESLNVAMAATVLLFHIAAERRRLTGP